MRDSVRASDRRRAVDVGGNGASILLTILAGLATPAPFSWFLFGAGLALTAWWALTLRNASRSVARATKKAAGRSGGSECAENRT